ncbi:MAG: putative Zn-dependent protease [Lysobacterales bacterium]|jgi:predicted Zn-dependent protease
MKMLFRYCLLSCLMCIQGCAVLGTYNPATEKTEFIAISTHQEVTMGYDVHTTIQGKFNFSDDRPLLDRLEKITSKLSIVSDRQDYEYKFYLVEDDSLNAFTTPGGSIYVHTGLLKAMPSDDQVAFVIAHEIGHCAAKHVAKKYQAALGYDLIGNILLEQISSEGYVRTIASLSSDVIMKLVFSAYSRADENEADRLGVKYTYLAGYDPQGGVESFQILRQEDKKSFMPHMLRSHTQLDQRITNIKKEIEAIKIKYGRFRK